MKSRHRAFAAAVLSGALVCAVAYGQTLKSREAREAIARVLGLDKADRVRVENISPAMGGQAIVEAHIQATFRFEQDKEGRWRAMEVRTGDRDWESLELMQTAIRKEKILRTTADMRTLSTALDAFRRARGHYVIAESGAALVDNLAPGFLRTVIRLDAWSREFQYRGTAGAYRLTSLGPDGEPNTADDIVVENGQLIRGAAQ